MSSKPRVAIFTPSKDSYSETFISNHITHLPFEISVFYGGYFPWKCEGEVDTSKREAVLNLYDIAKRKREGVSTYRRKRLIELLKKKRIQCVLAEYVITGSQVWEVCKELNIPLIATGLGYEVSMYSVLEKYAEDYKAYGRYASDTIVVARNMIDTLAGFDIPAERITWSPAGPAQSFFELVTTGDDPFFVSIGRFVEKKAPHLSILAFARVAEAHPRARLKMAGDGPLLQVCKDIVDALGLGSQVEFIGRIDQEEQRRLLSNCRAFVQHSRQAADGDKEGTPVAILEASAAAVPILSTRHSGIPDIVKEGKTGYLVDEGDVPAMSDAMEKLLSDASAAKAMGGEGRAFVRENFTLDKHIATIAASINKAIAAR